MFPFRNSLAEERRRALVFFQKQAGLRFRDTGLLDLAFHHRSFSNENTKHEQSKSRINNERLEFLGDAVLGMVTAARLYSLMSEYSEGDLAKIKSVVVSEDTLSGIALTLHVNEYLVLGKGEEMSGGRQKKAILADALEAIIGALYLDSGYKAAEHFVLSLMNPQIQLVVQNRHARDHKSLLQEYIQKKYKTVPKYTLVKKTGPDHDRTFWVTVDVQGKTYGPESGKNKKEAEQAAAGTACRSLSLY
ncbi:ribonuclease III [Brucepastera parasyntrophica]|uniref:ribonuclease III n=1 Tax=Brucepastera parasyntrophica TaxID=2880008 RepID=UPI00210C2CF8|nr:ribonuclease III [Brucepastera parasyntrophica]ULQ59972.1 ribonuclease III [Brucepastera parasyntrophica]